MSQILKAIADKYAEIQFETERMVYSILVSAKLKPVDLKNLNLGDIIKQLHEVDLVGINFEEGEFILNEHYEVHSVSGSRDEDGDPMVMIHLYDLVEDEAHSIRWHEFPHIADALEIIKRVDEKARIKYV